LQCTFFIHAIWLLLIMHLAFGTIKTNPAKPLKA
jgi:hypothetical protein